MFDDLSRADMTRMWVLTANTNTINARWLGGMLQLPLFARVRNTVQHALEHPDLTPEGRARLIALLLDV